MKAPKGWSKFLKSQIRKITSGCTPEIVAAIEEGAKLAYDYQNDKIKTIKAENDRLYLDYDVLLKENAQMKAAIEEADEEETCHMCKVYNHGNCQGKPCICDRFVSEYPSDEDDIGDDIEEDCEDLWKDE